MPRFAYLDLITTAGAPGAKAQVSQVVGDWASRVAEQVKVAHEGWAALSATGLPVPVVSTFPLQDPGAEMPGLHYAVGMTWWDGQIRHRCFLVPEADYAQVDFHPYALLASLAADLPASPPSPDRYKGEDPDPEAVSLITEGIQQLLTRGTLHLPLGSLDPDCDRILALLVSAVPVRTRAGLKFTSFSPIEPWLWNLAAAHQPGGSLVDWKRRVLNLTGVDQGPDATAYIQSVNDLLAAGNFRGLEELARRSSFHPALNAGVKPAARVLPVRLAPTGAVPGAAPPVARPREQALPGRNPVPQESPATRAPKRRVVLERRKLRNVTIVGPHGRRGNAGRVVPILAVLLLLAGGWWLGSVPGLSLSSVRQWLHRDGGPDTEPQAAPLLSVVDVGQSYSRILKEYRMRTLVDGWREDKARSQALDSLKVGAVRPLVGQMATYLTVVQEGIQQGSRPRREVRRLETLAGAGRDLGRDLQRLELAWYSLATGTCWRDLGSLPDSLVGSRYDSLAASGHDLDEEVAEALGLQGQSKALQLARNQAEAMGRLVDLFQVGSWQPQWQQDLLAAAGRVSPAASPITRTFDNCAFAFARLKAAEHTRQSRVLPFSRNWTQGTWPGAEVQAVLPKLREIVQAFPAGQAPGMVTATVKLYSTLENPERASLRAAADADFWQGLNGNPAVMFDPGLYEDVLGRLRFEALRPYLDRGDPPADWPDHLVTLAAAPIYQEFYALLGTVQDPDVWRAYAAEIPDPFLARWARRLGTGYEDAGRSRLTAIAEHPGCRAQAAMTAAMLAAMSSPQAVHIRGVEADLAAAGIGGPVTLELAVEPGGGGPLSQELLIPPMGHLEADLDWSLSLEPGQRVVVRVKDTTGGAILWQAVCPALLEGGGPEDLARELTSSGGKIIFDVDQAHWPQHELEDSNTIF